MWSLGVQGCNIYSHKQQRECSGATRRNAQPRDGGKRVAPEEMPGDSHGSIHRICALTETLRVCCSQSFSLVSITPSSKDPSSTTINPSIAKREKFALTISFRTSRFPG
jgi:hypothetical protein